MNRREAAEFIEHFLDYAALAGDAKSIKHRLCYEDTGPEGGDEFWQMSDWPAIEQTIERFLDQEGIR